jgi:hypothetical protein
VASELELERQRPSYQHRRQQSQLMEGEAERRVGVCENDRGVDRGVLRGLHDKERLRAVETFPLVTAWIWHPIVGGTHGVVRAT